MSEHDALRDNAGPWVLGALDDEEAWRFAAHLEVCNACRAEVHGLRAAADALPLSVPLAEPPPELKARLMAVVEREARERSAAAARRARSPRRIGRPAWLSLPALRPGLAAAAAAVLVAGIAVGVLVSSGGSAARAARTQTLAFDRAQAPDARGVLVRDAGGAALLRVSGMPAPPRGRVYEVWVQAPGRAPRADALFTVNGGGRGAVALLGRLRGARTVMVTDEPAGGATVPSRRPVLVVRSA